MRSMTLEPLPDYPSTASSHVTMVSMQDMPEDMPGLLPASGALGVPVTISVTKETTKSDDVSRAVREQHQRKTKAHPRFQG